MPKGAACRVLPPAPSAVADSGIRRFRRGGAGRCATARPSNPGPSGLRDFRQRRRSGRPRRIPAWPACRSRSAFPAIRGAAEDRTWRLIPVKNPRMERGIPSGVSCVSCGRSAFRELEASAGLAMTIFLAFDHAVVASEKSTVAQGAVLLGMQGLSGAGHTQNDRPGLSVDASACCPHPDIDLAEHPRRLERRFDEQPVTFDRKIIFEGAAVYSDL